MTTVRWPLLDFFLDWLGQAVVSWACWVIGAQRGVVQRADARWTALLVA